MPIIELNILEIINKAHLCCVFLKNNMISPTIDIIIAILEKTKFGNIFTKYILLSKLSLGAKIEAMMPTMLPIVK